MKRIAIALTPDFADWECALLTATARSFLGVEIVTASPGGDLLRSMGGIKVVPDTSHDELDANAFDALVIPGGLSWEKGEAPDLNGLIHRFHDKGRLVAGICAAASVLADSGVLNGVRHTGNSLASHQAQPAYKGAALYVDQPQAVSDGGIITAPGSSPFTFTVEILKALDLMSDEARQELGSFAREFSEP